MKYLAKSFVLMLGSGFISFTSNAAESKNSENPWEVFKEVIHTYKTSNVQFYFTPKDQQAAFLNAAKEMKQKIAEKSDFHSEDKLKRIDQTVTIFKFLWETKDETEYTEIENIEIPEIQ